jgi:hypothetical protein
VTKKLSKAEIEAQVWKKAFEMLAKNAPPQEVAEVTAEMQAEPKKRAPRAQKKAIDKDEHKDKNEGIDWTKVKTSCSSCDHVGPVIPDFGTRNDRGTTYKQSRCRKCRSKINYHAEPRRYNVSDPSRRR